MKYQNTAQNAKLPTAAKRVSMDHSKIVLSKKVNNPLQNFIDTKKRSDEYGIREAIVQWVREMQTSIYNRTWQFS